MYYVLSVTCSSWTVQDFLIEWIEQHFFFTGTVTAAGTSYTETSKSRLKDITS